jgi:superfamily I DNA/RNA helicase
MRFAIANTFQRALQKLEGKDSLAAKLAKQAAFDFQMNPAQPGFSFERLNNCKDPNFWSLRVNDNVRIIAHRASDIVTLCYIDRHDEAYQWAERRRFEVHPATGAAQIVEIRETVREITKVIEKQVKPPLFSGFEGDYLLALGVPTEWLDAVCHVSEDNFDALIGHLPDEAVERLLDLAAGKLVPRPETTKGVTDATALLHPDAQRRFRVIDNQQELRQALDFPWDQWIIFLHPTQRSVVERSFSGPARVTGSAGTGKSVVALHRAAWLARQNAKAKILLTTFSKTLATRLAQNADILLGKSAERTQIEVEHLHKIARDLWVKNKGRAFHAVTAKRLTALIEASQAAVDGATKFSASFLRSEFEAVVDPSGITTWEQYKDAFRANRGTPLGLRQKLTIWRVFETLLQLLAKEDLSTWNSLCNQAAQSSTVPLYDHVVADEVQDFGPAELRLVRALAAPGRNDILLCGDSGQRIYKPGTSPLRCGLDVRGRTTQLKINYRTTQQIRRFADSLFSSSEADADGDPLTRDAVSILNGPTPQVVGSDSIASEVSGLAHWLELRLSEGMKPNEIAIFARTEAVLHDRAERALEEAGLKRQLLTDDDPATENHVSLGTMHRAKGLEFKAVAIVGCDFGLLPLRSVLDSIPDSVDRALFLEQERNLLYVALTRAREQVLVTHTSQPSDFLRSLSTARTALDTQRL